MRPRPSVLLILLIAACTDGRQYAARDSASYVDGFRGMSASPGFQQQQPARMARAVAVPAPDLPRIVMADNTATMVIRTATARIEVDSLEAAVAGVRQVAARVGGFIANAQMQTGAGQLRAATLDVKVPAARFDEALSGLTPIGRLESVDVQAADVGEEYVDVTARMENARRLERRLIELLATRTGKLKDVLDVEQSLARVREEIERYEGRLRYLKAHTATSTLTVTVHEPMPVVGVAGTSVMGEAFKQSWRNFVGFLAVLVQALGVVLPLGVLAGAGWLVVRRWRGSRPAGTAAA
ncbi:MAG TPA: DUF4349 domain-containing protein [Gemmatimonadales bacterium]|nr:DUF4349 domain-containing protein [Gemmatimonadales bacterium]